MNPEQPPVLENNEDITTKQHALEANLPGAVEHGGELEGVEGNTEAIEHAREAAVKTMSTETPFENVNMDANGTLFDPTKKETSEEKPNSSKWGSFVRKAAAVVGIGIAGTSAVHAQNKTGTVEKQGNKIENVKSTSNESIHEVTVDEEVAWNNFVSFIQSKNLNGNTELNHVEFSKNLVAEFNEHAAIPLDWNSIKSIQHGINEIKQKEIAEVKAGRAVVVDQNGKELSVEQLMQNTSPEDGIPGVKTVSYRFPLSVDRTVVTKNLNFHDEKNHKDYEIPFAKDLASTKKLITPEGDGINK